MVGTKLYSDAKLVGLQPSTKKYKDVAPISCVDSDQTADPYPSVRPNGLQVRNSSSSAKLLSYFSYLRKSIIFSTIANLNKTNLQALAYIDTVHDINSKLKLTPSYPVDLAEIEQKFGEPKAVDVGGVSKEGDKENASPTVVEKPTEKMEVVPKSPTVEVKDELSKVTRLIRILCNL